MSRINPGRAKYWVATDISFVLCTITSFIFYINDQRYLGRYGKCIYPLRKFSSHINLIQRLELNPRRGETVKRSRTGTVRR